MKILITPKKVLTQFLQYWKRGNKKQMYARTSRTWQSRYDKNAFQGTGLESFEIISEKQNGSTCDFQIKLNGEPHTVRLLCETAGYKASEKGDWGVFPGSFRAIKDEIGIKKVSVNDKEITYSEDNVVKMD